MTKRFTFGAVSPNVAMIKDNGQGLDIGEIVDLLNSLSEENEQLRKKLDVIKESNRINWNLIEFIYNEIKEEGSMDFSRIHDLVEIEDE